MKIFSPLWLAMAIFASGCESAKTTEPLADASNTADGSQDDAVGSDSGSAPDGEDATTDADSANGPITGQWCGAAGVGYEEHSFRVCGSNERWWLKAGAIYGPECGSRNPITCFSYACVKGTISPAKEVPHTGYGHLGSYARELTVTEVLEVRAMESGECPYAP